VGLTVYALIVSKCGGRIVDYFQTWYIKELQDEEAKLKDLPQTTVADPTTATDEHITMEAKKET
jgi:hypothetical protein